MPGQSSHATIAPPAPSLNAIGPNFGLGVFVIETPSAGQTRVPRASACCARMLQVGLCITQSIQAMIPPPDPSPTMVGVSSWEGADAICTPFESHATVPLPSICCAIAIPVTVSLRKDPTTTAPPSPSEVRAQLSSLSLLDPPVIPKTVTA